MARSGYSSPLSTVSPGSRFGRQGMRAVALMLAVSFSLTSCAPSHHYYDEVSDGTRFYETMTGKKIHVTVDGEIYGEDGQKLGVARKGHEDWNLSAYEIDPSYSRCINLSDRNKTVPCWEYGMQIPVFLLAIPAGLAIFGAYLAGSFYCHGECNLSSGDPPSYSRTQERSNRGPTRDQGGPNMRGVPSVGNEDGLLRR